MRAGKRDESKTRAELIQELSALREKVAELEAERVLCLERTQDGCVSLDAAWEYASEAMMLTDRNGIVLKVNPACKKLCGKSAGEVLGKPFTHMLAPEMQEEAQRFYQNSMKRGSPAENLEITLHLANGKELEIELDTGFIQQNGQTVAALSIARDVTERKRAEKALRESNERYRAIVETDVEAICRWTPDTTLTFVNEGYCNLFGKSRQELLGTKWVYLVPEGTREDVIEFYRNLCSHPRKVDYAHEVIGPDGGVRWLHWTDSPITGSEGQVVEFQSVGRDITEHRLASKALQRRIEMESLMAEISTDFISLTLEEIDQALEHTLEKIGEFAGVDRSYIFLYAEDRQAVDNTHEWCAAGIEPQKENLQGLPVTTIAWSLEQLARFEPLYIPCVANLPAEALEKEMLLAQNIQSLLIVPLVYGDQAIGFVGFDSVREAKTWSDEDILLIRMSSEILCSALTRKQVDKALRQSNEALERRVEKRTQELARLNEELRAEILERQRTEAELNELQRRLMDSIEAERILLARELHDGPMQDLYAFSYRLACLNDEMPENERCEELEELKDNVNIIIDELRATARELRPPVLAPFGLAKALREHLELVEEQHPELAFTHDLMTDGTTLQERVRLTLFRIYQMALANILRHARARHVHVRLDLDAEEVRLEIRDDGQGFVLPERWISMAREGHLGLIGAFERAQAIGGTLEVESEPGKGTLVRVVVPREEWE